LHALVLLTIDVCFIVCVFSLKFLTQMSIVYKLSALIVSQGAGWKVQRRSGVGRWVYVAVETSGWWSYKTWKVGVSLWTCRTHTICRKYVL